MRLRLLGMMAAERDGRELSLPASRKTRAILGYLVLSPRPVSRQRLCDLFFDMPDDPRAALRWSLHKLRQLLDGAGTSRILAERDQLSFALDGVSVDVLDVLATGAAPAEALTGERIDASLRLLQGQLMEDADLPNRLDYSTWLSGWRQDLSTLEARLIDTRIQQLAADPARQVPYLQRWRLVEPQDETVHARLIEALARAGRRDEAMEAAAQAERSLRELGIVPGPGLRRGLRGLQRPMPKSVLSRDPNQDAGPAELICERESPADVPIATQLASTAGSRSGDGRPSVAVIPFWNHSPDQIEDALADGFLESAIHMVSRFKELRVAGVSASLQFRRSDLRDPAEMGRCLDAQILVGGSLIAGADGLKVRYRIVLAATGEMLASGDLACPKVDADAMLEQAPARLATLVVHHVDSQLRTRAIALDPADRLPAEHVAVGRHLGLFATPLDVRGALDAFERALEQADGWPLALAYSAWAKAQLGYGRDPSRRANALEQARAAMAQADDDYQAMAISAWASVALGGDFATALEAAEFAIRLNPHARIAWSTGAWLRTLNGEFETPMAYWRRAEANNPLLANYDTTLAGRALCSALGGRFQDAAHWARACLLKSPSHPAGHVAAVLAAADSGDEAALSQAAAQFLAYHPEGADTPVIIAIPIQDPVRRQRMLDELRAALGQTGSRTGDDTAVPMLETDSGTSGSEPVVAVLPMVDLSATPLPGHVLAGFTDGLTHALSRFRSLIVVNQASSDRYAGRLEDPAAISGALGADILVGGSLAASDDGRLRLRWRVLEGRNGRLLAAGDLDGTRQDLWNFQEEAASRIAVEVEPRAQGEALKVRLKRPTRNHDAYDLYLQALFVGFSLEGRDYHRSLELLEQALALDPRLHQALALAPWAAAYGNRISSAEDLARYADMSRKALRIGRDDARTLATAGTALFYMAHAFGPARAAIDRALALNPNEYTAWICGGWMDAMKGCSDRAHDMFDRAERLNPLAYGANGLMSGRAMADFMVGRLAEAERHIELALAGDDTHPSALMTGIATAAGLELDAKLRERTRGFLTIYPDGITSLAIQSLPFEDPACRTRYFEAVQAGIERANG